MQPTGLPHLTVFFVLPHGHVLENNEMLSVIEKLNSTVNRHKVIHLVMKLPLVKLEQPKLAINYDILKTK